LYGLRLRGRRSLLVFLGLMFIAVFIDLVMNVIGRLVVALVLGRVGVILCLSGRGAGGRNLAA
jgi:hypothetical protein